MMLRSERAAILVDCGMFQGPKTLKALNYSAFPFEPTKLDAVLLTHAHVDHSGLLPKLVLAGFDRAIHATEGTVELCRSLLPDSGAIQDMEVDALNRRRERRGEAKVAPVFTRKDAEACMERFQVVELNVWIDVAPGVRARWWDAGHILGSASIEVEVEDEGETQRILFSGDLGPGGRDFANDPTGPVDVDHVVLESTYGGVERAEIGVEERRAALTRELLAAHAAGGPLLIPAFAVERTQELLVDLLEVMEGGAAPRGAIFLDSPLAIRATNTFLRHGTLESGENPFRRLHESNWLQFTETVSESRALERVRGWHVIIAASGMCEAGRVRHHLKRLLWREEATVLLVGYQAAGTLGRLLQDGRRAIRIQGEDIKARARIRSLDVYSGHADARGLLRWAGARKPISGSIFLNHGEPENLEALKRRLSEDGFESEKVVIAELDQVYRLKHARLGARENPRAPRIEPRAASRLDWHNARSLFLAALNERLNGAASDAERETILAALAKQMQEQG
jgi:metallo-beta-lactamase family protein